MTDLVLIDLLQLFPEAVFHHEIDGVVSLERAVLPEDSVLEDKWELVTFLKSLCFFVWFLLEGPYLHPTTTVDVDFAHIMKLAVLMKLHRRTQLTRHTLTHIHLTLKSGTPDMNHSHRHD